MTGGNYSLNGGFWSRYAVQTAGAPTLLITYAGNQAIVSWSPSATGWTLQTNANLATGAWGSYLGPRERVKPEVGPARARLFMVLDVAARFVTLRSCRTRCALLQCQPLV